MFGPYPIYVVDDDPGMRSFLSEFFDRHGLVARCFENGELFLREIDHLEPGCVILDMRMPRMHGLQVQAEIAKRKGDWPVIAISGYSDVEMAVDSMRMGAIDFLEKPINRETLLETVAAAFRRLDAPD